MGGKLLCIRSLETGGADDTVEREGHKKRRAKIVARCGTRLAKASGNLTKIVLKTYNQVYTRT